MPIKRALRKEILDSINHKHKLNIKIQADLRGPVIRIGSNIPEEGIDVKDGQILKFVTLPCHNKKVDEIEIDDPYLHADVKVGDPMLIGNGLIELEISRVFPDNHKFEARVIIGGLIFPRKGINLPITKLTTSSFTEKDISDLRHALKVGVDYVAMSFVSNANDLIKIRKLIGRKKVSVFSKIERREALVNLNEIIDASDGIIIARGDLGVEIPFEELPIFQKRIIRKCQRALKPVIVATQMLSSMVKNPIPTRAEVSDIANAIFEGAQYVWLSDETANGQYPVESVKAMKRIVEATDNYLDRCSV